MHTSALEIEAHAWSMLATGDHDSSDLQANLVSGPYRAIRDWTAGHLVAAFAWGATLRLAHTARIRDAARQPAR